MQFVKIHNGNYDIYLDLDSGTKIRKNDLDCFEPEKPESLDLKITNSCSQGCLYCHEDSKPNGKHGDIMNLKFLDTLLPYTELAIGGGNPLEHPDLIPFLRKCKDRKLICNMTVNQTHFLKEQALIKQLVDDKLIYGLGVSPVFINDTLIQTLQQYPNAVVHMINGVHTLEDYRKLYDKGLKVLILGYKEFRRGQDYHSAKVEENKEKISVFLPEILDHFSVVSFDNLALKQLDVKSLLTPEQWESFYMGDDGQMTCFVDAVENTYSVSSTSPLSERFPISDDMGDMFRHIRQLASKHKGV